MHHLARSGGTMISRCLGCMDHVVLLGETHPLGANKFNPMIQAINWFDLFPPRMSHQLLQMQLSFTDAIGLIEEQCRLRNKYLVIRDWTHLDYTGVPFVADPPYELSSAKVLASEFLPLQSITVRHPLDQWLSLSRLGIYRGDIEKQLPLERYLYGYRRFAEECQRVNFMRYEDFTLQPEPSLQALCHMLDLPYDADFIHKWADYRSNVTSRPEVDASRAVATGRTIRPYTPVKAPLELLRRCEANADYRASLDLLGYVHPA